MKLKLRKALKVHVLFYACIRNNTSRLLHMDTLYLSIA